LKRIVDEDQSFVARRSDLHPQTNKQFVDVSQMNKQFVDASQANKQFVDVSQVLRTLMRIKSRIVLPP
jgi:hypothetical protein